MFSSRKTNSEGGREGGREGGEGGREGGREGGGREGGRVGFCYEKQTYRKQTHSGRGGLFLLHKTNSEGEGGEFVFPKTPNAGKAFPTKELWRSGEVCFSCRNKLCRCVSPAKP